jgi:hypothetical protein
MKKAMTAATRVRRPSTTKDLAARTSSVKAGAVQASYQVLPYVEQRNSSASRGASGRLGSLAVDPSDPS